MARRREAGTGPTLEERVDMVMEVRGRCGVHTIEQGMFKATIPENC